MSGETEQAVSGWTVETLTIACDTTIERLPAVFDRIGVALTAANLT